MQYTMCAHLCAKLFGQRKFSNFIKIAQKITKL